MQCGPDNSLADTRLCRVVQNPNLTEELQKYFRKMSEWVEKQQMKLNVKAMHTEEENKQPKKTPEVHVHLVIVTTKKDILELSWTVL